MGGCWSIAVLGQQGLRLLRVPGRDEYAGVSVRKSTVAGVTSVVRSERNQERPGADGLSWLCQCYGGPQMVPLSYIYP